MKERCLMVPTILVTIVALITKVSCQLVECPDNANYTGCIECYQYNSRIEPICSCFNDQFSILGKCFKPEYPCNQSYFPFIYDDAYQQINLWTTTIAPFLQTLFGTSQIRYSNRFYANNNELKFRNMGLDHKRIWTQAYYLYIILLKDVSLNNQTRTQLITDSTQFAQSIMDLDSRNKWYELSKFYNRKLQKNLTLQEFYSFVKQKAKLIAPCHDCDKMYGIIKQNGKFRCSKCSSNCLRCQNNTNVCTRCLEGYLLNSDGKCEQCNMIGGCKICSTRSQCLRCQQGKTNSGNNDRCLNCIQECTTCFRGETSLCQLCNQMIFNQLPGSHGACYTCNKVQCKNCDQRKKDECMECYDGYYLVNRVCFPCQPNCLKCDNFGCFECQFGYGLIQGTCQVCSMPGCLSCNQNKQSCSACVGPYFKFDDQTLTCTLMNITQTAKKYFKQSIHCRPGCNYCYQNNTDLCHNCADRYFIKDQYCYKCMPGCIKCSSLKTCKLCNSGYAHYIERDCILCPPNCRRCNNINISECFDCRHGFDLVNGTCVESLTPECLFFGTSKNISQCHLCLPGHTLNQNKKCIKCDMSCNQTCQPTNISQCRRSKLVIGKSFNFRHGYKDIGCKAEINGQCVLPQTGYRLQKNGNYISAKMKCLYPCKTCQKGQCLSCEPEYQLQSGKCVFNSSCNPNCKSCPAGTQRNMTTNICINCPLQNCAVCLNGQCLECHQGYYYDIKGDVQDCKPCPQKCRKCYDQRNCHDCAPGYFFPIQYGLNLNPFDCIKCSQNCLTCKYWPGFCISCPPGTRIMNFRCIKQYYVSYRYIFEANYTNFTLFAQSDRFIANVVEMLKIGNQDIFISVKNGSTIVEGYISALNQARALQIYNTIKNSKLPNWNYQILGSSFSFMNETKVISCESFGKDACLGESKGLSTGKIILIVAGVLCSLLLIGVLVYCCWKRRKNYSDEQQIQHLNQIHTERPESDNNFRTSKNEKEELQSQNQK